MNRRYDDLTFDQYMRWLGWLAKVELERAGVHIEEQKKQ